MTARSRRTAAMGPATPVPTAFSIPMAKPHADVRQDSKGTEQSAQPSMPVRSAMEDVLPKLSVKEPSQEAVFVCARQAIQAMALCALK